VGRKGGREKLSGGPTIPSGYFFGILTDSIWHKDGGYVALLGFHFVGTLLQLWGDG
jgi:hypothetical protein